ncbi:hypothetical protein PCASD_14431 [Puccinia coronata f. sp. avenae]|uniref:DDE Tnp4 domain-containing protein n=1 Tax=Puccinia coronata f. sp. avenae TaxID=200324 RepID=A0A2N5UDL3_9BASI|nr:hypothetical protein PCASD_14431 [Puccinia coronata f. sp. avenae]
MFSPKDIFILDDLPNHAASLTLKKLFNMLDSEFQQAARTSKEGFMHVLDKIVGHEVLHRGGRRPQLPIPHQLTLTLERIGSNGNGASIGRFSCNLTVGRGTVVKVLQWVFEAVISLGQTYVQWPDKDHCAEISDAMRKEGFPGCVGFVDGTTIPMFQRPGFDGNSKAYKRMQLHLDPTQFFDEGQYLLADSAYESSHTVIPGYKSPASNIQINAEFNYCLAKARVQNEHTIGILNCIILHNFLATLGDQWLNLDSKDQNQLPSGSSDPDVAGSIKDF